MLSGLAMIAAAVGVLIFRSNNPESAANRFPSPVCPSYTFAGIHCPGCGATRAVHALANFDVPAAWRKNSLLVIALPFLLVAGAGRWLRWIAPKLNWPPKWNLPHAVQWSILVVILAYGVLRNVPVEPFSLMAPR